MDTFIINPVDKLQEDALQAILNYMKIPFEKENETDYILSNEYLKNKLIESRNDMNEGKGEKIDIDNLWK